MKKENLSRYEFLKTMGFRGAALMAVLTSCINEEDMFVEAPVLNANGVAVANPTSGATATNTGGTTGTGTTGTGSTGTGSTGTTNTGAKGTSTIVTTADLSAIKSPLLKVDLAASNAKNLLSVGGYVILSNIVLAQVSAGSYAAVQNLCTHEPKKKIIFNKTEWYCTDHGARFETITAAPTNKVAPKALVVYKVATDGKTVVVYS